MRIIGVILVVFVACTSCVSRTENNRGEPQVVIDPLYLRAREIVASMDDRLLTAHILMSASEGRDTLNSGMQELFAQIPAGGIILFRHNLNTSNENIRNYLAQIKSLITEGAGIAPFVSVDHEGGTVNRFSRGVADLPNASFYWNMSQEQGKDAALAKITEDTFRAGSVIHGLGINMNLAPVAEHLIDDNRSFLSRRSYGPDPEFVAQAAMAFIKGMEQAGIICVVKHFPGSAGPDPHHSASVINMEKPDLDMLISPFAAIIKNGARAMMAAHTAVPVLDNRIASLSPVIMGNWLRGELEFDGIIISDDFIMAAAGGQRPEEAAVQSVAAGSDMILVWPNHLRATHTAFLEALESGALSRERLNDAVFRIIYEKLKMGLIE
ncbi:MAG: glycoside hydrolase family 3 protein [Treponema sp.]|nr:glycoside hydrolase family 3 protein [Treponema sp.]